jgi:hypothetical protein
MRKLAFVVLLVSALAVCGARPAEAFGSAAHVYIAQRVLITLSPNALYGAAAPDIIGYLPPELAASLEPNHVYFDLVPAAERLPEFMFALGWMTHNQEWGADFTTHVKPGYAWVKGDLLLSQLPPEMATLLGPNARLLAHITAEVAVDLLLKRQDPLLGLKVYEAAKYRSARIPALLDSSGAIPLGPQGTAIAEETFRQITMQYGLALAAPNAREALAQLMSGMAEGVYGAQVTPVEAGAVLDLAVLLCQNDYLKVVNQSIDRIRPKMWRFVF